MWRVFSPLSTSLFSSSPSFSSLFRLTSTTRPPKQRKEGEEKEHVKRRVAMLVGYVGTPYFGLQQQKDSVKYPTIEQELIDGVFQAGLVKPTNKENKKKMGWNISSRTDKGVHSVCTVISFKAELNKKEYEKAEQEDELPSNQVELLPSDNPLNRPKMLNFLESSIKKKTNQFLSDNVRVLSVSRASRGYNARYRCTKRTYEYILPLHSLNKFYQTEKWDLFYNEREEAEREREGEREGERERGREREGEGGKGVEEVVEELNEIWKMFEGNFNFHNYTDYGLQRRKIKGKIARKNKKKNLPGWFLEREKQRKAMTMGLEEEEIEEEEEEEEEGGRRRVVWGEMGEGGEEEMERERLEERRRRYRYEWKEDKKNFWHGYQTLWRIVHECNVDKVTINNEDCVRFSITGESFLLHQIRKMVAMTLAVGSGYFPKEMVNYTLGPFRVHIPRAPGSGLLLSSNEFMSTVPFSAKEEFELFAKEGRYFGEGEMNDNHDNIKNDIINNNNKNDVWEDGDGVGYEESVKNFKKFYIYPHVLGLSKGERGVQGKWTYAGEWKYLGKELKRMGMGEEERQLLKECFDEWEIERKRRKEEKERERDGVEEEEGEEGGEGGEEDSEAANLDVFFFLDFGHFLVLLET